MVAESHVQDVALQHWAAPPPPPLPSQSGNDAPPILPNKPTGRTNQRPMPHAQQSMSSSWEEVQQLQHELEVLRASFDELQKLYGSKCGEVIVLTKRVEHWQRLASGQHGQPQQEPLISSTSSKQAPQNTSDASSQHLRSQQPIQSSSRSTPAAILTPSQQQHQQLNKEASASNPHHNNNNNPNAKYCSVCDVWVNSDATLRSHQQGERHRKFLNRAMNAVFTAAPAPQPSCGSTESVEVTGEKPEPKAERVQDVHQPKTSSLIEEPRDVDDVRFAGVQPQLLAGDASMSSPGRHAHDSPPHSEVQQAIEPLDLQQIAITEPAL